MNSSSRSRHRSWLLVAILGDRHALDQFHDEVGPARSVVPASKTLAIFGMVHQRQRLPLGFEAGDDLARVHARLDELSATGRLTGCCLLGDPDRPHAAFADLLQQLVRADLFRRYIRASVAIS